MKVKIGKQMVDVSSSGCSAALDCFQIGRDKGTFAQGKGYTSYHKEEVLCCWTRHLNGCPDAGECLDCRTICSPAAFVLGKCGHCGSRLIRRKGET